jgi:epoxyqueuosine reductase
MSSESNLNKPAADRLAACVKDEALRLGFDLVGIAPAVSPAGASHLQRWLDAGFSGEMAYMERRREAYADPERVLLNVRSIVMLALNYRGEPPQPLPAGAGRISRYAWSDVDYHDVLREKLQRLADALHRECPGCRTRVIVDTAPLLERDFARLAGLGWFGKNTMLINKRLGSWFFLGALLTDAELSPDEPHHTSHCGTCTRCLDACPTEAFSAPYVLDARRCISYLTIELRGRTIPEDLRPMMDDWVFGCDVCQDVCPWNTKAPMTQEPAFRKGEGRDRLILHDLLPLSDEQFQQRFGDTPLVRPGRDALTANACIAAGNTGNASQIATLQTARQDRSELVRNAAEWAESQLRQRLSGSADRADAADRRDSSGEALPVEPAR